MRRAARIHGRARWPLAILACVALASLQTGADHEGEEHELSIIATIGLFGATDLFALPDGTGPAGRLYVIAYEGVAVERGPIAPRHGPAAMAMYCAEGRTPACRITDPYVVEFSVDEAGGGLLRAVDAGLGEIAVRVRPGWGPGAGVGYSDQEGLWGGWDWRSEVEFDALHPLLVEGMPPGLGVWAGALEGAVGSLYTDPSNDDDATGAGGRGGYTFRAALSTVMMRWQTLHWG